MAFLKDTAVLFMLNGIGFILPFMGLYHYLEIPLVFSLGISWVVDSVFVAWLSLGGDDDKK